MCDFEVEYEYEQDIKFPLSISVSFVGFADGFPREDARLRAV